MSFKKQYSPKPGTAAYLSKHRFTRKSHDLELFDQSNMVNYIALYVAIVSPLPVSVEEAMDIAYGNAVIPEEAIVTDEILSKIKNYFRTSTLKSSVKYTKAEKKFRVNRYKIKAYLDGELRPCKNDAERKPIRTLSEYATKISINSKGRSAG